MFMFIATTNPADITDPAHTVGVEVTTPDVAALCRVNIDGQHGTGKCSYDGVALGMWLQQTMNYHPAQDTAIAIATHVMVPAQFRRALPELRDPAAPPATPFDDWTTFVTTRPDADSIGAMAVIVIRTLGFWPAEGSDSENAVRDRVRAIAEADAFTPSADWSPSPLPTEENPWPRAGSVDSAAGLAHLGMICSPRRGDVVLPLAERVAVIACWLLLGEGGDMPMNQSDESGPIVTEIYAACGLAPWFDIETSPMSRLIAASLRAVDSRKELARAAQRDGAIELDIGIPNCCAFPELGHRRPCDGVQCGNCGAWCPLVAVVRVSHAGAVGLGYCVAPVVIAFDQANHGKVTIAAYSSRYLDVPGLKARLAALELGWGGGATIIGSPQVGGTKLSDETIIAQVRACRS